MASCGDTRSTEDGEGSAGEPRPVVFPAGELVWAKGSTIHVGDTAYDISPHVVDDLDWTPYRLYLRLVVDPAIGTTSHAEYDGEELHEIDDVYSDIVTSEDGAYVGWINRNGPQRPAGRVAEVVVYDTETGDEVYASSEGMGGDEGDDLGDRYEELSPWVGAIKGDALYWTDAEGSGNYVTTDLTTGESVRSDNGPGSRFEETSGYLYRSPDGAYRVNAQRTGKLRVKPDQPDFRHKWQTQGGWLDDHVMVVLEQDRFQFSYDPSVPDTTPGWIEACDLDTGHCRVLEQVKGARDVVFAGVDVDY